MITGPYAKELARDGIKVSEAIPGYVATDPNDGTGHRTPDQAAEIVATSPPSPLLHPREVCWAPSLAPRTGSTSTGGGEDLPHRRPRGTAAERTILVPDATPEYVATLGREQKKPCGPARRRGRLPVSGCTG